MRKARNYVFTINFADGEPTQLLSEEFPSWLTYVVWQLELGEEGTLHYQGYLECRGAQLFTRIQREVPGFEGAHFEVRRGSQEQAIAYAEKEDSRVDGPWHHGEPKAQGARNDLINVKEKLDSGVSLKRVAEENFSSWARYGRAFKEYKRIVTKPRDFKSITFLFIGPPGKGKSTMMEHILPKILGLTAYKAPMKKGSGMYYDDYDGQDILILDEFDGSRMRPEEFNAICDEHECVLPVHGGAGHQMVSKYVFIGTNYLPRQWWKNRNATQLRQTERRIDVVFKMGFKEGPARRAIQYDPQQQCFQSTSPALRLDGPVVSGYFDQHGRYHPKGG